MKFQDFDKQIQDVPHTVIKDWEIELPYDANYQPVIAKAREYGLTTWHVNVKIPTDLNLTPPISIWWDDKKGISLTEKQLDIH